MAKLANRFVVEVFTDVYPTAHQGVYKTKALAMEAFASMRTQMFQNKPVTIHDEIGFTEIDCEHVVSIGWYDIKAKAAADAHCGVIQSDARVVVWKKSEGAGGNTVNAWINEVPDLYKHPMGEEPAPAPLVPRRAPERDVSLDSFSAVID